MESREVLAQLAEEGIRIHRETLARVSDELGLKTRQSTGRQVPRRWSRPQVRALLDHFGKADLGACGPRAPQRLTDSGGPFPSRDVLAHLRSHGHPMHRETLARISDQLGLPTRAAPHGPRQWTLQQVEAIQDFLVRRQSVEALAQSLLVNAAAELDPDDLHALLAGNPDVTRQLLDQVTTILREHLVTTPAETPARKPRGGREEAA